jgi:CRP-like cAMP-binding protein
MEKLHATLRHLISISDEELNDFLALCYEKTFAAKAFLSHQGEISHEIFFITSGLTRSTIIDHAGNEHTIHFSMEGQFIADYTSFLVSTPSTNSVQALEESSVVVMPRKAIEWGYAHLAQGDKLGRTIAEFYFLYFDNRLKNQYVFTPAQRYENIAQIFPNIHNRVPQHMIASYLGISPVHLSRLKKGSR